MQLRIENNLCSIDNYKQIKSLSNALIVIDTIRLTGSDFTILKLDNEKIVITGKFVRIDLGE
jgi:hypothetical protein